MTHHLPGADLSDVVMIGAGGAGAAVGHALLGLGVDHLQVVDVDRTRASARAEHLQRCFPDRRVTAVAVVELGPTVRSASGLVHCTPTGMSAHPGRPIDVDDLRTEHWVADIVYRPLETELVRAARERGCATLDGGYMATYQAVDAFELITGLRPDPHRMLADLRELAADR